MQRHLTIERPNWRLQAESLGFGFHTMYGEPYWDETKFYSFSLRQIEEELEDATQLLHAMSLEAVDYALRHEEWLDKLRVPAYYRDWIAKSWERKDPSLYGRFDLAYNGLEPAKMLEYNADTPTSLYETGFFQWLWLEEKIADHSLPKQSDQFNSLQDQLIARLAELLPAGRSIHFSSCRDSIEDRQTTRYLEDCAVQAGLLPIFSYIEDIGVDLQGSFADSDSQIISTMFKLYPWEDMFREEFGNFLPLDATRFIEPPWKSILSNKGLLPLLWHLFPNHPNLLPAYFIEDPEASKIGKNYVKKPLFSREGANISVTLENEAIEISDGDYGSEGYIVQQYTKLPRFDEDVAVIGSWVVGDTPAGIGIREDNSIITKNLSRFVPHVIL